MAAKEVKFGVDARQKMLERGDIYNNVMAGMRSNGIADPMANL